MDKELVLKIAEIEDSHWWYVGRRAIVEQLLCDLQPVDKAQILEIGCGSGGNLSMLSQYGDVVAIEPDPTARQIAAGRKVCPVYEGYLPDHIPHQQKNFDIVVALDVIEHVADDNSSVSRMVELTKPGGHILVSVPAHQWLWSGHDEINGHHRRYSRKSLAKTFSDDRIEVLRLTYFNSFLFPAAVVARLIGRGSKGALDLPRTGTNQLLSRIFRTERRILPRYNLPFGLSLLLLAKVSE